MIKKLLVYLLIFVFSISLAYAVPASWYGYVILDSSTASDGVVVDAYISSSIAGTTTVGAVQSNGYYLIHVEGNSGDSVSFKIYGNNVSEAAKTWSAGFQHPAFNLTANRTANGQACPTYSGYTSGTNVVNLGCAGGYCVHDICRAASTHCGDGYCDTGESCSSDDSACSSGYACTNGCQATTTTTGGGGGFTPTCTEYWTCTDWSECSPEGIQTRTCTDSNNCGTTTNKPEESQSCIPEIIPIEEEPAPFVEEQPIPVPEEQPMPKEIPVEVKPIMMPLEAGVAIIIIAALIAIILVLKQPKEKKKR